MVKIMGQILILIIQMEPFQKLPLCRLAWLKKINVKFQPNYTDIYIERSRKDLQGGRKNDWRSIKSIGNIIIASIN